MGSTKKLSKKDFKKIDDLCESLTGMRLLNDGKQEIISQLKFIKQLQIDEAENANDQLINFLGTLK